MKIKPKVGDLVKVIDPYFGHKPFEYAYCTESTELYFSLRYFEFIEDTNPYEYWYEMDYDLKMSIISGC